jgi:hypothetical protein
MHVSKTLLTLVLAGLAAVGAAAPAGSNTAASLDASEAGGLAKRPNFKIIYRAEEEEVEPLAKQALAKRPNFKIIYRGEEEEVEPLAKRPNFKIIYRGEEEEANAMP